MKPKYPRRADISQIARLAVEHAIGVPLTLQASKKIAGEKHTRTLTKRQQSGYR